MPRNLLSVGILALKPGLKPLRIAWMYLQEYFRGSIDDVRIWNRARSKAEIKADYQRRLQGNESGLVGYYHFAKQTASTVQKGD
ncbi:MAG: LamG domain-containing protein [Symploca sp. SIO1C4]|uniref:LamG domain-containing protein n=1 Tax=Symploca sp. SIO1C4 TaxID=2607765 RepID=A0A6B3NII1_9CYAN|nr:LamG domain-containing protein [Symploca sp. SIO1C4]